VRGVELLAEAIEAGLLLEGNAVVEPRLDNNGKPVLDVSGKPVMQPVMLAKYPGLHALRHFFCSWCANSTEKGGLGLSQGDTGPHGPSTLAMTADLYGHLFVGDEERDVLAAGEQALMGA
jgi:hypothetical protein